jgi:membrane protein DedA with SNARE-associated domain
MKSEPPPGKRQRFERWFNRYGMLTVFIPAVTPVLPLPLKVFVVSAGALKTPFSKFLAVILLARVIRYFGEAYLGIQLGADAQTFLARHVWVILGTALVLAAAAYVLIGMIDRRRETAG